MSNRSALEDVSALCRDGKHEWCANRSAAESPCQCSCHARAAPLASNERSDVLADLDAIATRRSRDLDWIDFRLLAEKAAKLIRSAPETTGDCCPCCGRSISVHDNADRLRAALKSDPLAGLRWICRSCTTVNGIDDERCLGCRKPREEHDRRAQKS